MILRSYLFLHRDLICYLYFCVSERSSCGERQQVVIERHRASRSERGQAVVDSKGESGCGGGRPSTGLRILFSKSFSGIKRIQLIMFICDKVGRG